MVDMPFMEARARLRRLHEGEMAMDDDAATAGTMAMNQDVAFGAKLSDL